MFCFQCEQTDKNIGCERVGVCGKKADTAGLQDILMYTAMGLSGWAHAGRQVGVVSKRADEVTLDAVFSTLTNVNFSNERLASYIKQLLDAREDLKTQVLAKNADVAAPDSVIYAGEHHPMNFQPKDTSVEGLEALVNTTPAGVLHRREAIGSETLAGLHELLVYGVKGMAAYAHHAMVLGYTDDKVFAYLHEALAFLASEECLDVNATLGKLLACGEANVVAMAQLDAANTSSYGVPTPKSVAIEPVEGKAILISGHDLKDLGLLLAQTEGTGINVYTHGEMLPANTYPELNKYSHLKGNYGSAWMNQKIEFTAFPGPILMTSNCIMPPMPKYKNRLFTTNPVGFDGVKHIVADANGNKDFSEIIEAAKAAPGFGAQAAPKEITVGFHHSAVLGIADTVVEAVKAGHIKRFFVIGGCDGSEQERNYFKEVAQATPPDTVILTAGCGKFRFNKLDLGTVPNVGIPRVLDMGQCNDSYGAVVVALKLAEVFGTDINGLPLTLCISWFEQKACAVLLSLLHLNVQGITLGPNLPAFLTPEALSVLIDKFSIRAANVKDAAADVKLFMG